MCINSGYWVLLERHCSQEKTQMLSRIERERERVWKCFLKHTHMNHIVFVCVCLCVYTCVCVGVCMCVCVCL